MSRTGSSTSSPDGRAGRHGAAGVAAAVLVALLATGCGFRPMHAESSRAAAETLSQVDIGLIPDRSGQILRNELLESFHRRDGGAPLRYVLNVELQESIQDLAVRKDDVATRANLTVVANFRLSDRSDGQPVLSGQSRSVNSYDILSSDFATLSARTNARERGIRQLASDIRERVSVWLIQSGGETARR